MAIACILPTAVEGDCWQIGGQPEYSPKDINRYSPYSTEVYNCSHVDTLADVDTQRGSPQAQGVIEAVRTCWRDDVYLDELGHRFWRLTLQVIFRYKNWLDDALPQREAPPQVATAIREEKVSNQDLGTSSIISIISFRLRWGWVEVVLLLLAHPPRVNLQKLPATKHD